MVRYIDITSNMTDDVIQHLRENFFADEPLNKAVNLCERGESHEALEEMCIATMHDGHSVAAVEGDNVRCFYANYHHHRLSQSTTGHFHHLFIH